MNTPSPALLRRALKIVDEIEKIDQQMHRLLTEMPVKQSSVENTDVALTQMTEGALSHLSESLHLPQEKSLQAKSLATPFIVEKKEAYFVDPAFPQHEQQSLLIDDSGIEQLAVVESASSEMKEESSKQYDQSCALF